MLFYNDIRSSIVVFLVALPLCLGVALASGAPLQAGLLTGIIGGIVVGFLGGSKLSVSGPTAGLVAIIGAAITELGSFEVVAAAVVFAGVLQIVLALCNGAKLADFFPNSVIKGMLAAIGIIIILKQFPHLLGFDMDFIGDESFAQQDGMNTFSEIYWAFKFWQTGPLIISAVTLSIILIWKNKKLQQYKFFNLIPGDLIAVITAIMLNEFVFAGTDLQLSQNHLVTLSMDKGIEGLVNFNFMHQLGHLSNLAFYKLVFGITVVASIESLLSVDAADKIDPEKNISDKKRELLAQGVGNILAGFLGALPVTAVIVRTSANVTAGAKSRWSTILHGFWLLVCVAFIPNILNKIPLACLGMILSVVGFRVTRPSLYKTMAKRGSAQLYPFIITVLAAVFTDTLTGVAIGFVFSIFFIIKADYTSSIIHIKDNNSHLIRFNKDVSFLNKSDLIKCFNEVPENAQLRIDGSRTIKIDADILDVIEDFIETAPHKNIKVSLQKSPLALVELFKGAHT
ncbi:MAG: SulP family inorganic anion transporter [Bacteriovoracaceae bacterium]|nr:SulP family inorganic anion transporter [Bacteriovoracaceae bacterium]